MSSLQRTGRVQWLGMTVAFLVAVGVGGTGQLAVVTMLSLLAVVLLALLPPRRKGWLWALAIGAGLGAAAHSVLPFAANTLPVWAVVVAIWLGAWMLVAHLAEMPRLGGWLGRGQSLLAPLAFGATLLWLWEVTVRALDVPRVILPAPSLIWARIIRSTDVLWVDFVQTFVKGALSGYAIGVGAALVFALLVDRSDFLRRGLLPVGNFLAALPIIGTAPIMVMWFGFDWPSKAAVVVAMVFFPMLVNTVQGLAATDAMQRDLMRTYNASWGQALLKLRLPAAMPFIFNGLKIASTLALIGAIVAEFFGSPTRGMGFRISTEVGRLQLDMVWAEIAVAALAGSLFYGIIALAEKGVTFWHPSQRGR
ncbi:NitT/TauT family transport system permease protein [Roseinatronobacter thiooxidans]|uniref:NitT/TauT family transport system permease protein n=2 Tax=Roseinatronobacter thiooxidans TaxID=121821 RepID=A0A2W7QEY2_9RHOB|nr:NitT/TauT family transport system permease protein [Roseinatronobacter thiooxidans]